MTFFLGGYDLEMVTIRDLLVAEGAGFHDRRLAWGARVSAYRKEVEQSLRDGRVLVLIELENDLGLPIRFVDTELSRKGFAPRTILAVDHHGARAGKKTPTALHQVFFLLGLPPARWTREFDLVAANDRGHVRGMRELTVPATQAEMVRIRAADRAAQGVCPEDERAARIAVERREIRAAGRLTVLRLDSPRTSPAADLMEPALGGPGFENLLVVSPGEVNFFGHGKLVRALDEAFPGGWSGGALPENGFWGSRSVNEKQVQDWIEERLTRDSLAG